MSENTFSQGLLSMHSSFIHITLFLIAGLFVNLPVLGQAPSTYIQVDQFGYLPKAEKVAVLHDPQEGFNEADTYVPGPIIEVKVSGTDSVVFFSNPVAWKSGAMHEQSGDTGWWFNFSSVQTPGTYYLYDVINGVKSADFVIGDEVYREVLKAAFKMFYYNRSNIPKEAPYAAEGWRDDSSFNKAFQDYNCRYIYDKGNPSLERDLSGGWFDAGDFNKYVTFADFAVHNLLWAYREHPEIFGDDWNIPESGNGIPDLIDEIKWELDWLLKMNNPDGSTHIKMGSRNYTENHASPPSVNSDPRYYGPTCTAASIAVAGMFAHAATVFSEFPTLSDYTLLLQTRAENAWNYVLPKLQNNLLETGCDDGSIVAGDADWDEATQREHALASALYLYGLTLDESYNLYLLAHADDAEPLRANFWSGYKLPLNDALLVYPLLPGADAALSQRIRNSIQADASHNWNGYYGFDDRDLFRAYMPDWAYHWGSNLPKAGFGILNHLLLNYSIDSSKSVSFYRKAAEQLHYFHGVNPLGMVQLSNMYSLGAEHGVNQVYHQWFADGTQWDDVQSSAFGPAPGYVTGGPNANFSVPTLSPPSGQPSQKSYLDFNEVSTKSWEITEPAIYYQAAYLRLLAYFVPKDTTSARLVKVKARLLLEGLLDIREGKMALFQGILPQQQPFADPPYSYHGSERSFTSSDTLVGWVLAEVRNPMNPEEILQQKAGVLSENGFVLDAETHGLLSFSGLPPGAYLLSIFHSSHLGVMSSQPLHFNTNPPLYDFSIAFDRAAGNQQLKEIQGRYVLYCGDYDGNGVINNLDFNRWKQEGATVNQYLSVDGDGNGIINNLDFNLWKANNSKIGIVPIQK